MVERRLPAIKLVKMLDLDPISAIPKVFRSIRDGVKQEFEIIFLGSEGTHTEHHIVGLELVKERWGGADTDYDSGL